MQGVLSQQITQIFTNTSYHKANKTYFISNPKLLAMFIVLFKNEKYPTNQRALSSQFMINLMYKSTPAIALFKREEIEDELKYLVGEIERVIDKNLIDKKYEEENEELEFLRIMLDNGRNVLNIISLDWQN